MSQKLTYEELEQRVTQLEQETKKRKQAEEALRQSEHQMEQYLGIAGVIFVALDHEGKISLINECGLETLGYRREELLGKNWFETCLPHEFQKDVLDVYRQLMKGEIETLEYYENPILRKDGGECIIAWHNKILQDSKGKTVGILSSGEDITERKNVETVLFQAKEEWEQTFNAVPDLISILDNNHRIIRANKAMADRLGTTAEALVGQTCYEVVHGTKEPPLFCPHSKLMNDAKEHFVEVFEKGLGGDFMVTVNPIYHKNSELGSVHVARDISRRKQMEVEQEKLIADLKQALDEVKTLSGLLPICASCKKIRDDKGYWNRIEEYIQKHSDAKFSHSMCPECSDKFYGKEDWYIEMIKKKY